MNKPIPAEGFQPDEPARIAEPPAPAPAPAATEVMAALQTDIWPVVVKLQHRPIVGNKGEEIRELSFREPTGGDINRCGNPVRIDQNGEIVIDERKMTLMMTALCGILTPMLERMDARDWNSCAYRLRVFFLPSLSALV